ncbi:hypothetical protein AZZ99_003047, partial [Serratia marcescens]
PHRRPQPHSLAAQAAQYRLSAKTLAG